jgi:DNA-binding transcriptional LysR family regulator
MDIRHLETLLAVSRLRSFSRAADELGYAQSTVTGQVKGLEAELGAQLLDRSGGLVKVTSAGQKLIPLAQRILDLVSEVEIVVREGDEPAGSVVVGSIESLITYQLSPLVELFHYRFPDIRLLMRPSLCPDTKQSLRNGEFDIGFLMAAETAHPGLTSITLCAEELVLVAAPGHPLTCLPQVTTADLRNASLLNTEYGCPYREMFESALSDGAQEPVHLLEFGTIEAIKQMAISGLGVTLLPRFAVAEEIRDSQLAVAAWPVPFTIFSQLAWRKDKWMSKVLQVFINESVKAFREDPAELRGLFRSTYRTTRGLIAVPVAIPAGIGRQNGQTSRARAHSGAPGLTLHTL